MSRGRLTLGDPPGFGQSGKEGEENLGRMGKTHTYIVHYGFVIVMTSSFLTHLECLNSQSTIAIDFVLVLMQLE